MTARNYFKIAMILFISISAFGAGFFQDSVNREADELRSQINELKNQMERIETRVQGIRLSDKEYENIVHGYLTDAIFYDRTFHALNDSISVEERGLYRDMVAAQVWNFRVYLFGIEIVQVYYWFQIRNDDYVIAYEARDGFNFTISKEFWDAYQVDFPDLVINLTYTEAFDYMSEYNGYTNGGLLLFDYYEEQSILPQWFLIPAYSHPSVYDNFFYQTLHDLQAEIISLEDDLIDLERKSSDYAYGLSLITVSAILASAMSDRMADREADSQFGNVLSKLYDDPSHETSDKDNLAFAILLLAGIIAIFGVLLPILF